MGYGATPHRKEESRGAAPNPASFLKRKRERRKSRKRCFRRGIIDFWGSTFPLGERIWDSCGSALPLGRENKKLCKSMPLGKKSGFKLKLHLSKTLHIPEKNGVFLLLKVFGIFKPFFQKGLKWGMGQRPIERKRGAPPRTPPLSWKERGKEE